MPVFSHLSAGPALDELKRLAARGEIHDAAGVRARAEIEIQARREKVWRVLWDSSRWHLWHSEVKALAPGAPLAAGGRFKWRSGGMTVRSEIAQIEPPHRLCWTGTAMGIKAIHRWRLKEVSPQATLVDTEESMDGYLIRLIYPSAKLESFLATWLTRLKQECEK